MKNLFLILAVLLVGSINADAQKKKTYIKSVRLHFPASGQMAEIKSGDKWKFSEFLYGAEKCHFESSICEPRINVKTGGTFRETIGKDSQPMAYTFGNCKNYSANGKRRECDLLTATTDVLTTQSGGNKIYLGEYAPNEKFEIRFDIWEDDDLVGSGWVFDGTDDEHDDIYVNVDLSKLTNGEKRFEKAADDRQQTCAQVSFVLFQE